MGGTKRAIRLATRFQCPHPVAVKMEHIKKKSMKRKRLSVSLRVSAKHAVKACRHVDVLAPKTTAIGRDSARTVNKSLSLTKLLK
jgi:hypothetical protein